MGSVTVVSMRFLIIFAVVVAVSWVWAGYRIVRRGNRAHAWWPCVARCVAALSVTVVFAADCVNSYYSYLPNVSDVVDAATQSTPPRITKVLATPRPRPPAHGSLATIAIPNGDGLGVTAAWVWLPPQYFTQPSSRFPVVYLFHGSPGLPADWFHAGEAQRFGARLAQQGRPVIEVAPQMSRNWLDDPECVDGVREKIETHLLHDVIPTIDRSLRTIPSRDGRIFAGMSAGGYCALNLGLRNRGMVSTILDMSGFTQPTHSGGMKALFGSDAARSAADNSPDVYARNLPAGPSMQIWLDSGTGDHQVIQQMAALAPTLRAVHMTVVQHTRTGGHTYSTWRPALLQSLTWALTQSPPE